MKALEKKSGSLVETRNPAWLLAYAKNTYSQKGEDGVIAKVLSHLPARDRWCVEFGAWDGQYLSNARRLIEEENYSAILIQGDERRFQDLKANYAGNSRVRAVNAFVGFEGPSGLDQILGEHPIPTNFDFLSIDNDGNDYHVWKAVQKYRPKVVCVEFNPTIPTEVSFVQQADPNINQGSSLCALNDLARSNNYELVSVLSYNAIFVDRPYFTCFGISDNEPRTLRKDLSFITWMFVGYDGSIHLDGAKRLQWHGLRLREGRLQALPRFLQRYPPSYSCLRRSLFQLLARGKVI